MSEKQESPGSDGSGEGSGRGQKSKSDDSGGWSEALLEDALRGDPQRCDILEVGNCSSWLSFSDIVITVLKTDACLYIHEHALITLLVCGTSRCLKSRQVWISLCTTSPWGDR